MLRLLVFFFRPPSVRSRMLSVLRPKLVAVHPNMMHVLFTHQDDP